MRLFDPVQRTLNAEGAQVAPSVVFAASRELIALACCRCALSG